MSSSISHEIKHRKKAKDVFITPPELAKSHIDMVSNMTSLKKWYDPFKNSGNYFNQFPDNGNTHKWSEILEGKDFFEYNDETEVICSNPPYSMIDPVLKKSIEINPKIISYLLCFHHLTTKRLELMENNGYTLVKMSLTKVFKWYGMSCIVIWEKDSNKQSVLGYDRKVWREGK